MCIVLKSFCLQYVAVSVGTVSKVTPPVGRNLDYPVLAMMLVEVVMLAGAGASGDQSIDVAGSVFAQ